MLEQKHRNQIITHRILNYLNACLQGKFAFLNILAQLKHPSLAPEAIQRTRKDLESVNTSLEELWEGNPLFQEEFGAQSSGALEILQLVKEQKPYLASLAQDIAALLTAETNEPNIPDMVLMVAAFGQNAYARDNYVRGYIRFGEVFSDTDLVEAWQPHLEEVDSRVTLANEFTQTMRQPEQITAASYQHLCFLCRTLPGVFYAYLHDLNQLLSAFRGEFTYERAEFIKSEIGPWERADIGPIEAGYWRAHGFNAKGAEDWKKMGVQDPLLAAEWLTAGFHPKQALPWISLKFSPLLAIQWGLAEFAPNEAADMIELGYYYPHLIPPEKLKEIGRRPVSQQVQPPAEEDPPSPLHDPSPSSEEEQD